MDGISDILRQRDFDIPPEVSAIKEYIRRHYDREVSVTVQPHSLLIVAKGASFVATLRLNEAALRKAAQTEKRLVFRIG